MNPRDFTFWLHGFFEIGRADVLTESQVQEIKNHLDLTLNGQRNVNPPNFISGNQTSCGDKSVFNFDISGLSGFYLNSQIKPNDIYVQISTNPCWRNDSTKYSAYYENNSLETELKNNYGIFPNSNQKIKVIIDNSLKPKYSNCADLSHYKDYHLVGLSRSGPGIANLGNISIMESLAC